MAKIPRSPEQIYDEFTRDMQQIFSQDLVSIALYGSGAKGEYRYKKSDINFLVILTENGIQQLDRAFSLVKKWRKRNVSVPLFLTRNYIESALDSYPIEFLNMQRQHILVHGEDILSGLVIAPENLRLQCEAQIRGKLLHLREEFLKTAGKKRALRNLLSRTVPAFSSLFTALLAFKGFEVPDKQEEILTGTARQFHLDDSVFRAVIEVRKGGGAKKADELVDVTNRYISEIRKLTSIVDSW